MSERCCNDCAWPEECAALKDCERRRRKEVRGQAILAARAGLGSPLPPLYEVEVIEIAAAIGPLVLTEANFLPMDKRDRRAVRRK